MKTAQFQCRTLCSFNDGFLFNPKATFENIFAQTYQRDCNKQIAPEQSFLGPHLPYAERSELPSRFLIVR